jgi:hypothetical protein
MRQSKPSIRMGQVFSRVVLPLVLFVVVVAGIAWLAQNLPQGQRASSPSVEAFKDDVEHYLKIDFDQAVWDKADENYAKEFEKEVPGHRDFPFTNTSNQELELGLHMANCVCSHVDLVLLPNGPLKDGEDPNKLPWKTLEKSDTASVPIPAGVSGRLRINWKNKKDVGTSPTLMGEIWCQVKDAPKTRKFQRVETRIAVVAPIMFLPDKVNVGPILDNATTKFTCWSATRKDFSLKVKDQTDPCFVYTIEPMTAKETAAFQDQLKESKLNSRVLSAYRVNVAIYENRDGKYLDLGYLDHKPTFVIESAHPPESRPSVDEVPGPHIHGLVSGDIVVGAPEDLNKINLKAFAAGTELKRTIPLSADAKADLKLLDQLPPKSNMKVELARNDKDSKGARSTWKLEITIPEFSFAGPLPEGSFILLQVSQTRRIRIPVLGNAVQR